MSETTQPAQPEVWSPEWFAIQIAGNEQDVEAKYAAWQNAVGAMNMLKQMHALAQQKALEKERARREAEAAQAEVEAAAVSVPAPGTDTVGELTVSDSSDAAQAAAVWAAG